MGGIFKKRPFHFGKEQLAILLTTIVVTLAANLRLGIAAGIFSNLIGSKKLLDSLPGQATVAFYLSQAGWWATRSWP